MALGLGFASRGQAGTGIAELIALSIHKLVKKRKTSRGRKCRKWGEGGRG